METLPLTRGRFIRIWWAYMWRVWVGVGIFLVPWLIIELKSPAIYYRWNATFQLAMAAWTIALWLIALYFALAKVYSEFRIALVPRDSTP